jgi:hypothetical protein
MRSTLTSSFLPQERRRSSLVALGYVLVIFPGKELALLRPNQLIAIAMAWMERQFF